MEPPDTRTPVVFESAIAPGVVRWSRSFAAAAALAVGGDSQCVANVRLVASELVSIVASVHPNETLRIELMASENAVVMKVSPWSDDAAPSDDGLDPWVIIGSVADDVSVSDGAVTVTCRFSETRP